MKWVEEDGEIAKVTNRNKQYHLKLRLKRSIECRGRDGLIMQKLRVKYVLMEAWDVMEIVMSIEVSGNWSRKSQAWEEEDT